MILVLCFMILYFAFMIVNAGAASREEPSYDTVMVQNGDTLWEIASSYCTGDIRHYIFEIKQINHMEQDTIREGQVILLP